RPTDWRSPRAALRPAEAHLVLSPAIRASFRPGARIAAEDLDHLAVALEGAQGVTHVVVIEVALQVHEEDVLPGFAAARARLDAAQVDAGAIEDGQRSHQRAALVARGEHDAGLVVARGACRVLRRSEDDETCDVRLAI